MSDTIPKMFSDAVKPDEMLIVPARKADESLEDWAKRCVKVTNIAPAQPSGEEEARAWWESLTIEQLGIKAEEASIWNVLKLMPKILAAYAAHREQQRAREAK